MASEVEIVDNGYALEAESVGQGLMFKAGKSDDG